MKLGVTAVHMRRIPISSYRTDVAENLVGGRLTHDFGPGFGGSSISLSVGTLYKFGAFSKSSVKWTSDHASRNADSIYKYFKHPFANDLKIAIYGSDQEATPGVANVRDGITIHLRHVQASRVPK